jgi:hypothetical protein
MDELSDLEKKISNEITNEWVWIFKVGLSIMHLCANVCRLHVKEVNLFATRCISIKIGYKKTWWCN